MHKVYLWLIAGLTFAGCQKYEVEQVTDKVSQEVAAQRAKKNNSKNVRLSYGDTIFYLKNQHVDYSILPFSKPNTPGYFKANPLGLVLDSITGRINVTQSETGLRYKVYYLSPTDERIDSVKLVISGIDYADGIYELRSTPVAYDTAFPIYNARPKLPLPCPSDDDDDDDDDGGDDDDQDCVFDETDLNNDGNDDVPGVIQDKLLIDIKQGTIDLEASFHAGVFGSSDPANGVTKDFTLYYRLNDSSNRALNKIIVRLYHFKKRSDIPHWLLNELNNKNNLAAEINSGVSFYNDTPNSLSGNSIQSPSSANSTTSVVSKPKRPPLIIIVSQS